MDLNAKNISLLIHFMEGLHTEKFNMFRFSHQCGSPSCALGWSSSVPELLEQGCDLQEINTGMRPYKIADDVFGCGAYERLFHSDLARTIKTPQEWASLARRVLAAAGLSVVPQTPKQSDDFKAFMERVLKPVSVTAERSYTGNDK